MSDSVQPRGLQPSRLLCPWDSPGKNTGAGCHFLFQGIFPTQGSNLHLLYLLHCRWILYCWTTRKPWRTVWKFLKKLKAERLSDPAIPLLGSWEMCGYFDNTLHLYRDRTLRSHWGENKCMTLSLQYKPFLKPLFFRYIFWYIDNPTFPFFLYVWCHGMFFNLPSCSKEEAHGFL